MGKLSRQEPRCKCSLDDEHAAALGEYLKDCGSLRLDQWGYKRMALNGWSRSELQRAAAILKKRGIIRVTIDYGGVLELELVEEACACPA